MEGRHPSGGTVSARGNSKSKGPRMVRARGSMCRSHQRVPSAGTEGPVVGDEASGWRDEAMQGASVSVPEDGSPGPHTEGGDVTPPGI